MKIKYRVSYMRQPTFKYGHKDFTILEEARQFLREHPLGIIPTWLIELRGGRRHRIIKCPRYPELTGREFSELKGEPERYVRLRDKIILIIGTEINNAKSTATG